MKRKQDLEFVLEHSETGKKRVRLHRLEDHPINDSTISHQSEENLGKSKGPQEKEETSSIVESLHKNKRLIWNVKPTLCKENTPDTKLYKTSVQELIGKDEDCVPFFDIAWKDHYKHLSLPTGIDCPVLPLNSSSLSLQKMEEASWLTVGVKIKPLLKSSVKICFPSYISSPVKNMEDESTPSENEMIENKIKYWVDKEMVNDSELKTTYSKVEIKFLRDEIIKYIQTHVLDDLWNEVFKREKRKNVAIFNMKRLRVHVEPFISEFKPVYHIDNEIMNIQVLNDKYSKTEITFLKRSMTEYLKINTLEELWKTEFKREKGKNNAIFNMQDLRACLESMVKEGTGKEIGKKSKQMIENKEVQRCVKIRVKPLNNDAKSIEDLRKMFGVYRYIFNECVDLDKQGEIDGAGTEEMRRIRSLLTKKENYQETKPWKDDLPSYPKQKAVHSYFQSKKEGMKRVSEGKIKHFEIRKKSRFKSRQQTIPFEKHAINNRMIKTVVNRKELKFWIKGKIPKAIKNRRDEKCLRTEMKLMMTRTGKFFVVVPITIKQSSKHVEDHGHICALDPGVRTFQTIYGTDGTVAQIGTSFSHVDSLLKKADALQSSIAKKTSTRNSRQKRQAKRRWLRHLEKVRNCVNDLHNKVASWLCNHYRLILIPSFDVSNMVANTNLHSKVCRKMYTWSHYKFKQKLIHQAQKYKDVKVRVVNEAYTSKTCGHCGSIHDDLGSNKVFKCLHCGIEQDRDEHASRNILLRSLPNILNI